MSCNVIYVVHPLLRHMIIWCTHTAKIMSHKAYDILSIFNYIYSFLIIIPMSIQITIIIINFSLRLNRCFCSIYNSQIDLAMCVKSVALVIWCNGNKSSVTFHFMSFHFKFSNQYLFKAEEGKCLFKSAKFTIYLFKNNNNLQLYRVLTTLTCRFLISAIYWTHYTHNERPSQC